MLRLLLVRHGETDWNGEHRIQGASSDVPLNAAGRRQAACTAIALKDQPIDAIYSSPQARARDTAEVIARLHGLTVQLEPDLREIEAGDFEGKSSYALRDTLNQFMAAYGEGRTPRLPGGEGLVQVQQRGWSTIERLTAGRTSGTIVVVSHYFTTLTIVCRALDFPLITMRRLRIMPGSINVIGFTDLGATLLGLNDTCHLDKAGPA